MKPECSRFAKTLKGRNSPQVKGVGEQGGYINPCKHEVGKIPECKSWMRGWRGEEVVK